MTKHACRHFKGFRVLMCESACSAGHDPRNQIIEISGSDVGLFYKIPCTKQSSEHNPVFNCPDLDRKNQAEMDKSRAEISKRMDALVRALPVINKIRDRMVRDKLSRTTEDCPWCGEDGALDISCAIEVNQHIHCRCKACGEGFIE